MRMIKETVLSLALVVATPLGAQETGPSEPLPHLRDVKDINDTLLVIALAKEIRDYCGSINGRVFKAIGIMKRLKRHANDLGYSDNEIRMYIDSDAEKARMRARGEAYLASKGVRYGDPETFCALGRAEIENNSAIGALLRAK